MGFDGQIGKAAEKKGPLAGIIRQIEALQGQLKSSAIRGNLSWRNGLESQLANLKRERDRLSR